MEEPKKQDQETKTSNQKNVIVRHRSPNYPAISLERAISLTRTLYEKFKQSPIAYEVAARGLDYSPTSSVGMQIMASISYYGLISVEGSGKDKRVKVSDFAFKIIMDTRVISPERDAAMKQAALSPSIFKKIKDDYPYHIPADEALEYDLVMKYKFNPASVSQLIKMYKETMDYAKVYESDIIGGDSGDIGISKNEIIEEYQSMTKPHDATLLIPKPPSLPAISMNIEEREIAKYPVGRDISIRIIASGHITQKAIRKLIKILEINIEDFPENDQSEAS